jgi:ParB family chromosome partitioning protein
MSVASDECYTPREFIERARRVMGSIDTDPASSTAAQRIVRAKRFYTIKTNGLTKRWSGNVWFQPPYSEAGKWVPKLIESFDNRDCVQAIALLNARVGSAWFQKLARRAWRCEKRKRIAFYGPGAEGPTESQKQRSRSGFLDSVFFYLGPNYDRFAAVFGDIGEISAPTMVVANVTQDARRCVVCRRPLSGLRVDAEVCSGACKQERYRERLRAARA